MPVFPIVGSPFNGTVKWMVGAVGLRLRGAKPTPQAEAFGRIPKNCPLGSFLDGIPPHRFESLRTQSKTRQKAIQSCCSYLVGAVGLEPTSLAAADFKSAAYANSATLPRCTFVSMAQCFIIANEQEQPGTPAKDTLLPWNAANMTPSQTHVQPRRVRTGRAAYSRLDLAASKTIPTRMSLSLTVKPSIPAKSITAPRITKPAGKIPARFG